MDMGEQPGVLGAGRDRRFGERGESRGRSGDDHVAEDPPWHVGNRRVVAGPAIDHETSAAGRLQRQLGNDRVKKDGRRMVQASAGQSRSGAEDLQPRC